MVVHAGIEGEGFARADEFDFGGAEEVGTEEEGDFAREEGLGVFVVEIEDAGCVGGDLGGGHDAFNSGNG